MGGGIGMGNTCKPMAVSFQCMTKSTTNKKKKNKKKTKTLIAFLFFLLLNLEKDSFLVTIAKAGDIK